MSYPVVSNIDPYERGVQPPSCGISNTVLAVAAALFAGAFVGLAVAGSMGSRSRLTARQASGSAVPMSIVDALRVELDAEHCVANHVPVGTYAVTVPNRPVVYTH